MKTAHAALAFVVLPLLGTAQPKKNGSETLTGCVARVPNTTDKFVIAVDDRCMLLAGSFDAARIADRRITVTGVVTEPTGMLPLTLTTSSVLRTLAACSKTCVLEPPGTRGVHGKERPGAEGGTPGLRGSAEHPPE